MSEVTVLDYLREQFALLSAKLDAIIGCEHPHPGPLPKGEAKAKRIRRHSPDCSEIGVPSVKRL